MGGWQVGVQPHRGGGNCYCLCSAKAIFINLSCAFSRKLSQTHDVALAVQLTKHATAVRAAAAPFLSNHPRRGNAQTHFCHFCLPCVLGCYREASSQVTRLSMSEEDGLCTEMWRVLFRLHSYIDLSWEKTKCEHHQHLPSDKTRLCGGDN